MLYGIIQSQPVRRKLEHFWDSQGTIVVFSHFATIAELLTELTKGKNPDKVKWTDNCEAAFWKLKELLTTPPVLKVVELDKPYILQTDASELGLGAVLSQWEENGEEHPVSFASRKLLPREKNYSIIEKECLAIVWSLQVFHVYLFGQKFIVETDHQPLSWLERMKNSPVGIRCTTILS